MASTVYTSGGDAIPSSDEGVSYPLCGVDEAPGALFTDGEQRNMHARFQIKVGEVCINVFGGNPTVSLPAVFENYMTTDVTVDNGNLAGTDTDYELEGYVLDFPAGGITSSSFDQPSPQVKSDASVKMDN